MDDRNRVRCWQARIGAHNAHHSPIDIVSARPDPTLDPGILYGWWRSGKRGDALQRLMDAVLEALDSASRTASSIADFSVTGSGGLVG